MATIDDIDFTGEADSTAAVQSLVSEGSLTLPPGKIRISAPIVIDKTIKLQGAGKFQAITDPAYQTAFLLANPQADGLQLLSPVQGTALSDFSILPVSETGQTDGAMIRVGSPTVNVNRTQFHNLYMYRPVTGICWENGAYHHTSNCDVIYASYVGMQIANAHNADSGDSLIAGGIIHAENGFGSAGILWQSSGGLKVQGLKILNAQHGFFVHQDSALGSTANIIISGCSMEGQTYACVRLRQLTHGGVLKRVQVVGNQLNPRGPYGVLAQTTGASQWIQGLSIAGNFVSLRESLTAIDLNGVSGGIVSGNCIEKRGQVENEYGIYLRGATSNITEGPNELIGIAAGREFINGSSSNSNRRAQTVAV